MGKRNIIERGMTQKMERIKRMAKVQRQKTSGNERGEVKVWSGAGRGKR
jgi:ATP:corrinoid adenosyltransferase